MKDTVTLREYRKDDAPYLEEVIRTTWNYDKFCPPKTARRMARLYLMSCLSRQTFTRVALQDEIPVGIIMGRAAKLRPSRRFTLRLAWAELMMLCRREDRSILKAFSGIDEIDRALLKESGTDYTGELAFFAVAGSCRGTGVGKMLFTQLLTYMKAQHAERFYLYTDSSCNYGFYEHQGMKRRGEKKHSVAIGVDNQMQFYLYEYDTSPH